MEHFTFEVFNFDRAAKERMLFSTSVDVPAGEQVPVQDISRVLRFLFPQAAGVRVNIM